MTLICLLTLCAAQAQAQVKTDQAPQQVTVNGTRTDMDASRDAIAGKIVIGKQRIAESGVQNVGELLRREPAISIGKDGRLGLLGLPGYTQVLVDGLPPQGDAFALDLVQVERIEIVRSTTAATGPVGIAGTINIVRRKAERKAFSQASVGATSTGGRAGANVSWMNNQVAADSPFVYNLSLSARRTKTPKSSHYLETRAVGDTGPVPEFEGDSAASNVLDMVNASSEFTWTLDADNKISLRPDIGRFRVVDDGIERRRWQDGRLLALERDNRNTMDTWGLPLQWTRQLDADSALSLRLNMNRPRVKIDAPSLEAWSDAPLRRRTYAQRWRGRNYFVDLDFNTVLRGGHAITAGAKLVRNENDKTYTDLVDGVQDASLAVFGRESATRTDSGRLFLQDEWRIDRTFALNAGLSVERRVYDLAEGPVRNRADFNMWSPSLHLSKKIGGDRRRQVRLSLARSFQPPFADQLLLHPTINPFAPCQPGRPCGANGIDTADRAGNPALQPERALGLNLSYTHGIGSASEVMVEGYARDIADKTGWEYAFGSVPWASAPRYVYRPVNLGTATVRGVNLEGRVAGKDLSTDLATLEMHGSLGFARSELSDVPGPDNRIDGQSPWRAKLGGSYTLKAAPLKLGVEASVLPGEWTRSSASERVYQSSRRTLGINGSWKLDARSKVTVNLDNLLHRSTTRIEEYRTVDALLRQSTGAADHARIGIKFDTSL
ncbi:TonB-dependent siderophore receptor [uncultured Massilia sp.]|uniref:TonB-dependent receptor plug domain-containing protein n=1 Tax=uncultured Massilia sp. TaxID=169973 RepID=UPI0025D08F01|nr:TonB-dependent receptor [uncultured Massilia sp.]